MFIINIGRWNLAELFQRAFRPIKYASGADDGKRCTCRCTTPLALLVPCSRDLKTELTPRGGTRSQVDAENRVTRVLSRFSGATGARGHHDIGETLRMHGNVKTYCRGKVPREVR
ncbi:hypothetical protein QE152_g26527 [Popillia japonica]|uniref:Uncharacterized protein n=1 Tax=Popillia japonica TaxID=7064 RepID=A0AAW1JYJ3_POPJA